MRAFDSSSSVPDTKMRKSLGGAIERIFQTTSIGDHRCAVVRNRLALLFKLLAGAAK
jgi:hypothetical protein